MSASAASFTARRSTAASSSAAAAASAASSARRAEAIEIDDDDEDIDMTEVKTASPHTQVKQAVKGRRPASPSPSALEVDESSPTNAAAAASASPPSSSLGASSNVTRSSLLSSMSPLLLPFHRDIIRQLSHSDGLVVLGRGIGIEHVWAGFLAQYLQVLPSPPPAVALPTVLAGDGAAAAGSSAASAAPSSASPHLVFLLNFDGELLQWMNEMFQTHHHPSAGASLGDLRSRGIRQINAEYNVVERQQLYLQGGLLAITSRILTVDLLNSVISCDLISGFCIHSAHQVSDVSPESFILRIWRKKNKVGWIKAMSEDAPAFGRGGGRGQATAFGGLEVVMKALFLRKVWLYPRFTISVNESLNLPEEEMQEEEGGDQKHQQMVNPPRSRFALDIEELHQPFTELMTSTQNLLVEVIDTLITQLKNENRHLTVYDTPTHGNNRTPGAASSADASTSRTFQSLNLSIEAGLMKNFEHILRAELNPIQHKLSHKTKSILADMNALRLAISYLIHYDCVTFYRYLLMIKSAAVNNVSGWSATWLMSDAAEKLFKVAKQRLYSYQPGGTEEMAEKLRKKNEKDRKAKLLKAKEEEAAAATKRKQPARGKSGAVATGTGSSKTDAMELSDDDDPPAADCSPVFQPSSTSSDAISLRLEENPKWSLLLDTLEEIEGKVVQRAQEYQQSGRAQEAGDIMRGGTVREKHTNDGRVKLEDAPRGACGPVDLPPSFGRTLILVRDARTATFLTRLLTVGGRNLLKGYWKKYLFSLKLHKRVFLPPPQPTAPAPGSKAAPQSASHLSSAYLQAQRETHLLKSELESLIADEQLNRYMDAQTFQAEVREQRRAQGVEEEREKARQEKEENSPFDLDETAPDDEKQLTLTQLTTKEKEKAKAEAAKKKAARASSKAAPASSSASSPAKSAFASQFKGGQKDAAIEALEREVDEEFAMEDTPITTAAAGAASKSSLRIGPLQFEPNSSSAGPSKGKRSAPKPPISESAASAAARKRAKTTRTSSPAKGDGEPVDDEDRMDTDDPKQSDPAEADADMLLASEERDAAESAAEMMNPASFNLPSGQSFIRPPDSASSSSAMLYDRSEYSVVDGAFQMGEVVDATAGGMGGGTGERKSSPFFPGMNKSTAAAGAASSTAAASPSDITAEALSHLSSSTTVTVLPAFSLLVHPLTGVHSILHRWKPEYVILFDPDIRAIRELEVYQSLPTTQWQVHVSFLLYPNSIEEQRYITSVEQENKAFEQLIQTKKNMVVPVEQSGTLPEPQARVQSQEDRKNSHLYEDGMRNVTYEAYAATLPKAGDTRRGGAATDTPGTILVDVREFRSSLPSLLHAANLTIQPITLEIADYILTPTLAIERKSVPDLIGSLASGRLYKQMEQAIRYYKTPVLLIEFDRSRPFMLISKSELSADINAKSVLSKLALLILHFPQMRILWSRDSHATSHLFLMLKQNQAQPTVEQAVTANTNSIKANQAGYEFADLGAGAGLTEDEREEQNLSLTPHDILRKLPGVNLTNIRVLLQHVNNLRELCEASLADLTKWMAGAPLAKKLYNFLHEEP